MMPFLPTLLKPNPSPTRCRSRKEKKKQPSQDGSHWDVGIVIICCDIYHVFVWMFIGKWVPVGSMYGIFTYTLVDFYSKCRQIYLGCGPLPVSNSDHQDYYIFSRGFRKRPSFAIVGRGPHPKYTVHSSYLLGQWLNGFNFLGLHI